MAEILNAHGSKNDIFVAAMTPRDFATDEDLRAFVRRLCDRAGPFGGDGIYLFSAPGVHMAAWFSTTPVSILLRRVFERIHST